jgi:hypothetical protein
MEDNTHEALKSRQRATKRPSILKRILKIFGVLIGLFVLFLGILSGIVYFKEDELYALAVAELNDNQVGRLEIEGIELSPFRAFPYISVDLKNITFYADKSDSAEVIYHFDDIYAGFDIWDLLRGEFTITRLIVNDGFIRMVKYEDGSVNLLNAKAMPHREAELEDESHIHLDLQKIKLNNIRFEEINLQANQHLDITIKKAVSRVKHIKDVLDIFFDGEMHMTEYKSNNIALFKNKDFEIHTEFLYDSIAQFITFQPGQLTLQQGSLDFGGTIDLANDITLDFDIHGRKKNFDLFIAFAPEEIFEKMERFKNEGDIYFKGKISGPVLNQNPSINLELGCSNTSFLRKDNSKAIKDLSFRGTFTTGEANTLETSELVLENFYGVPESGLFKGTFRVYDFTNPKFSVDFHADLDLANLESFYDFDFIDDASGHVIIDITINEFMEADSAIHAMTQLEDGTLSRVLFKNVGIKLSDYHQPIRKINGRLELDGDDIVMDNLSASAGESDFSLNFRLKNVLSIVHGYDAPVDFYMHGESRKLDPSQLIPPKANATEQAEMPIIKNLSFDLDIKGNSLEMLKYDYLPKADLRLRNMAFSAEKYPHKISEIRGDIHMSDNLLHLDDFTILIGPNDFHVHVKVENPDALMSDNLKEKVLYGLKLESRFIDLKKILVWDGKSLLDPETEKELGDEIIRDLVYEGSGHFHSNSFCPNGFLSETKITRLEVKLNDLPKIGKFKGQIQTDTTGCIYLKDLFCQIGKSDFRADLTLKNYLDSMATDKTIKGKLGGDLWDFDDLTGYVESTQSAVNHEEAFNPFALPFPKLDLEVKVGHIKHHKYLLDSFAGTFSTTPDHYVHFENLKVKAAGGDFSLKGYLNGSDKNNIYMSGTLKIKDVNLD